MPQPPAAPKPCGSTQDKLVELFEKANYEPQSNAFKAYFFTNVSGTLHETISTMTCLAASRATSMRPARGHARRAVCGS